MLKYQEKAINIINSYTLSTLPHTIAIIGDKGSGRRTLLQYMVDSYNIECEDITFNISLDKINDVILSNTIKFYLIQIDDITEKVQNSLLKLLEEPSDTNYIVLIAENADSMLSTIYNRCFVIEMEHYTKEQLSSFTSDEFILGIVKTPGQVLDLANNNIADIQSLCRKIFACIKTANFANCLVLPNKLKFKSDEKGFDCDIFFKMLLVESSQESFERYILTKEFYRNTKIPHIDKKKLYEKYLLELKQL